MSKLELLALIEERKRRQARRKMDRYTAYPKQQEFHHLAMRERLLMASNRFGKTECGAAEMAMHLTGRYPDWWQGKRFDSPIKAWAAGVTSETTRDVVQDKLIGPPDREADWGTGYIPGDAIGGTDRARGIANALDTVSVKHVSGGWSSLQFKSYERGREKWQGTGLQVVWFDEEPPMDIYTEGLTRTNETGGIVYTTFTPLKGYSDVVALFLGDQVTGASRGYVRATIDDALHLDAATKATIIASYQPHELEARTQGLPSMGSGLVYPVTEASIICDPIPIPAHWPQIVGIDFGWDHPFSACWLAWDREADRIYVTKEYQEREATPIIHAAAIKPAGAWIPVAWPHDGLNAEKGSGRPLMELYRAQGLAMLSEKATHPDGSNSVEAGIADILDRMQTGRFKVFSTCAKVLEERRTYHRDKGKIVKERDDLLDAMRYGVMMLRYARTKPSHTAVKLQPMGIA
jgi:phage terminase large subunit-like protein